MSRFFDPSLGRFTSPDTIVPTSTQGTQAWDRYAFVNNNPVRYNDPTGHQTDSTNDRGSTHGCDNNVADCDHSKCYDTAANNYRDEGPCTYPSKIDSTTTLESLLLDNPAFDPFGCKYSGSLDCIYPGSEREKYDSAMLDLYITLGIDIDYYAARGLPNPVDVNLLPYELQHHLPFDAARYPILLFFLELEKDTGNKLYGNADLQTFMNFEANYVFRLMATHPGALNRAIGVYNNMPPEQRSTYENMDYPGPYGP